MAGMYSWEDFLKELESSGLRGQFSDADMRLAQANPDVGMGILGYKKQWNGTTDENLRARYNEGANALRSSYGGYTGGANGGTYLKDPLAPRDFTFRDAPTYQNRYDDRIQELLNAVTNREDFSYDVERDPLFAQYRKQYLREGKRAGADAMGQAAAMSGGLPSSYAGTAAGQAANYYNAKLTDKVPELEELAYQKYLNDFDMDRSKLAAVQSAEQSDYQKYLTDLSQYNTDRSFAYGQFSDQLSREERDRETAYQKDQDARTRALEEALTGAQFGDYSRLNELGFDTSGYQANEERQRALEEAQLRAQYGDLSGLRDLGIDTSAYEASLKASSRVSGGSSGGGSTTKTSTDGSLLPLISNAASKSEVFDTIYAVTGDRLLANQYAEDWEASHKQTGAAEYKPRLTYDQVMEQVDAGNITPQVKTDYEYWTGATLEEPSKQGDTAKSGSIGLKEPAASASSRDKFLYSFTQSANSGTDLDTLAAQLDTAVENGWITAKEAESLRLQAQLNNALFFSGKK